MKQAAKRLRANHKRRVVASLLLSCAMSAVLLFARIVDADNVRYYFLLWNLLLAGVPLGLAVWLRARLKTTSWLNWVNLLITTLWLLFLPNSFYLVTDLIHLHQTYEVNILYDAVMFTSFIANGFILGYMALYYVHIELASRVRRRDAHLVISGVLLVCSFAIFLGRYLRWNSWDVFLHPAGVLFDVSSQIIDPSSPSLFVTTFSFFILLTSIYGVVWNVAMHARAPRA